VVRVAVVRLAATRFASLRLAAVPVATDWLHRLLSPYALRLTPYALRLTPYALRLTPYALRLTPYALRLTPYALRFSFRFPLSLFVARCFSFVVSGPLFPVHCFSSVVCWSFAAFRVSPFLFRVSFFTFRLCPFPFDLLQFFFLLSELALPHKLCIRGRRRRDMRDGGLAVGIIGTAAGSGTVGGADTQRQRRRPWRAVHAGNPVEWSMRGVRTSDHASGSAVIKPLQTKKKYRLEAERSARESSSRLLVEIALCSEQNARRRSRGYTVGQTLKARV